MQLRGYVESKSAKDLAACQKTQMLQQLRFNVDRHLPLGAYSTWKCVVGFQRRGKTPALTAFAMKNLKKIQQ